MRPIEVKEYDAIELKLGIKSSLPHVKSAVAFIIALWEACGQKSECTYSQQVSDKISINDETFEHLKEYFHGIIPDETDFRNTININPLISSQMEALKVAFELIWKLGIFEFEDTSKVFSSERQGGSRFTKKISFTKNIDIVNLVIKQDEAFKNILYSWISNLDLEDQYKVNEEDLVSALTLISEEAVYRLRLDSSNDLKFMNLGIYERFENGTEQVNAHDYHENMGSLRILHNIISDDLSLYLKKQGRFFVLKKPIAELHEYAKRVEKYLSLTTIKIDVIIQENNSPDDDASSGASVLAFPYNRILFGAPGTGKSYKLEKQRVFFGDNYERVTFHPNYSYAQFVGTYKPKPKPKLDGTEYVSYEFVIGPFLRLWASATKNPNTNYLLIVEEINRANVAAVFGDVFQLLDRTVEGISEYAIATSEDLRDYLVKQHDFTEEEVKKIKIPKNLYIWATMNSADQGVFPMDAAFKRRWNFEYISIDEGSGFIEGKTITLKPYGTIHWNSIRTKINDRLTHPDLNVNEDKLIGPFFITDNELKSDKIDEVFKSKLLIYLFEDVLKHRKGKFFASQYNTFSKVLAAYDNDENIFDFEIDTASSSLVYAEDSNRDLKVAEKKEDY